MADIFMLYLQRGLIDVGLLGGAQIDRFSNINSTMDKQPEEELRIIREELDLKRIYI
jgi:hypothetical protein